MSIDPKLKAYAEQDMEYPYAELPDGTRMSMRNEIGQILPLVCRELSRLDHELEVERAITKSLRERLIRVESGIDGHYDHLTEQAEKEARDAE